MRCGIISPSNEVVRLRALLFAYYFLPRTGFVTGAAITGWWRFKYHCCPMPTMLLVRIYTAKPLEIGEIMKIPAMVTGMIFIIICCCGSVEVMGVILETRYMDRPIMTGKTQYGSRAESAVI